MADTTVTADLYTTTTGLIQRSAASFASGVPEDGDDGFFGPAIVTWRMNADLALPVAGLRSLLLQALHPQAMAGVDQHSSWHRDPVGTLAVTMAYLPAFTFRRSGSDHASPRPGCGASRIMSAARTRLPAARTRRAIPLSCSGVHGALVDSVLAAGIVVGTAAGWRASGFPPSAAAW